MKTSVLALALAVAVGLTAHGDALPRFIPLIPNGANVLNVPAVGHADHTGDSGSLDAFGVAFKKAGRKWTTSLCKADSDDDGQTNGEELGDPCCVWIVGTKPKFTAGVSNPGDPSSKVSASVLTSNACNASASAMPAKESLAATASPGVSKAFNNSESSPSSTSRPPSGEKGTPAPSATSGASIVTTMVVVTLIPWITTLAQ